MSSKSSRCRSGVSPGAPSFTPFTFAQYQFPLAHEFHGRLRAEYSYTGKKYYNNAQDDLIAALKMIVAVRALPKMRSGKIVRKALREAIAGRPFSAATIDDLSALESCLAALRQS